MEPSKLPQPVDRHLQASGSQESSAECGLPKQKGLMPSQGLQAQRPAAGMGWATHFRSISSASYSYTTEGSTVGTTARAPSNLAADASRSPCASPRLLLLASSTPSAGSGPGQGQLTDRDSRGRTGQLLL